ncbi:hypothetical protein As57867_007585, partial [Aphanomyces stellatus]
YAGCVFTVVSVTPAGNFIDVVDQDCVAMHTALTGGPFAITMVLPWNAAATQVQRVLQAAADKTFETGIWATGRRVSVQKTVLGKYGAVSWLIRFLFNPGLTPPGAGNINPLIVSFASPVPTCLCAVTIMETQRGSVPLSGDFTVDYHSSDGPRTVHYDSTSDRLERMLNEMNTLGLVKVSKFNIPSIAMGCTTTACAGGWDGAVVANDGTRGGYRWKVRFLKNPGTYNGLTYPPGTGNMNALN